ncbi:PH domain-containing protein [Pseudoclavibacter sp. CFCC 13611]|uniref:PH domain-containing protein n=1 Tax=Pseudoclavibacter sp. CFCC 13611 TaxID=2615178 RepID=UPI001300D635|nr:PH domain-containing protein [Pseudoclavibacter sp. CFCC 13611]KAB1663574.1 PH domain-containing protein [Pseudoclavibacter sp. CFCC 13611]
MSGESEHPTTGRSEPEWHRLNPRTALVGVVNLLLRGVPVAIAAIVLKNAGDGFPFALVALMVGLLLQPVSYLVRYATFRYRFTEREFEVTSGLLSRTRHRVPLERIRTVEIESRLLHRLLRVSVVNIATGEAKADQRIKLDAVDQHHAETLRSLLLRQRAPKDAQIVPAGGWPDATGRPETSHSEPGHPSTLQRSVDERGVSNTARDDVETPIIALRGRWAFYEIFTVRTLTIPLILFGAFWQLVENFNLLSGEQIEGLYTSAQRAFVGLALAAPLVVAVLVLMSLGAITLFFVNWWGFTLVRSGHRFVSRRGLLTTKTSAVDARRIRGITMSDSIVMRLVRGVQLVPITTGLGGLGTSSGTGGGPASNDARLLPTVGRTEAHTLAEILLGDCDGGCDDGRIAELPGGSMPTDAQLFRRGWLNQHPLVALRRRLIRLWLWDLVLAAVCAAFVFGLGWSASLLWAPAALAVLHIGVAFGDYRQLGHRLIGVDDRGASVGTVMRPTICVRQGFVLRKVHLLQLRGVCGVAVDQSWLQRRAGVATVILSTAAGEHAYRVRDCSERQAAEILRAAAGDEALSR